MATSEVRPLRAVLGVALGGVLLAGVGLSAPPAGASVGLSAVPAAGAGLSAIPAVADGRQLAARPDATAAGPVDVSADRHANQRSSLSELRDLRSPLQSGGWRGAPPPAPELDPPTVQSDGPDSATRSGSAAQSDRATQAGEATQSDGPTGGPADGPTAGTGPAAAAAAQDEPVPAVDPAAPTGTFALSSGALWIGQTVTLSQLTLTDDVDAPSAIVRTVNWGDGTAAQPLDPGSTKATKVYARPGRYPVTVTLTDTVGNTGQATIANPVVTVTTPPGRFTVSKRAVWHGEQFGVALSGVAAGTTSITVDWGDGWKSTFPGRNQTGRARIYHTPQGKLVRPGTILIRATFTNRLGTSAWVTLATMTLKRDAWRPTIKLTKPKKPTRISSWKYIRGTAADRGSGTPVVELFVVQKRGTAWYCYTPKKTWKRVRTQAQMDRCVNLVVPVVKGKWALRLKGAKKGTLWVDHISYDWSDLHSGWRTTKQQLTGK